MYNAILLTNKNDTKCGLQNKNYAKMSLHFRWPKRDEMKCYNFISSRLVALLLLLLLFSIFCFPCFTSGAASGRTAHFLKPHSQHYLEDNNKQSYVWHRERDRWPARQDSSLGEKEETTFEKNFYYIEVEKKTECVVEKDGEKCSVVKRPGTSVQSRY